MRVIRYIYCTQLLEGSRRPASLTHRSVRLAQTMVSYWKLHKLEVKNIRSSAFPDIAKGGDNFNICGLDHSGSVTGCTGGNVAVLN